MWIFYRWRRIWAWGNDDWEYEDMILSDQSEWEIFAEEEAQEKAEEYNWSDKFRGVEMEQVERPPEKWLRRQVERSERLVGYYTERASRFRDILTGGKS